MHVLLSAETFGYFQNFGTNTYSNKRMCCVHEMHQFVQKCMYFMHIHTWQPYQERQRGVLRVNAPSLALQPSSWNVAAATNQTATRTATMTATVTVTSRISTATLGYIRTCEQHCVSHKGTSSVMSPATSPAQGVKAALREKPNAKSSHGSRQVSRKTA